MSKASPEMAMIFSILIFPSLVCAQARPVAPAAPAAVTEPAERGERDKERAERDKERAERDKERAEREKERGERRYERGARALDRREWDEAVASFQEVAAEGKARADGALYWKAYGLAKLGRGAEAMAALDELAKKHPQSRWLNDARVMKGRDRAGGRTARCGPRTPPTTR